MPRNNCPAPADAARAAATQLHPARRTAALIALWTLAAGANLSSAAAPLVFASDTSAAPAQSAYIGASAPDLPPFALVIRTLGALPEVRAAEQVRRAELANQDRLVAGTHEWQARQGLSRRQVEGAGTLTEWELAVERPWRSGHKADIDRRLGEAGVLYAENAIGDATHEAARGLLRRWFELRRGVGELKLLKDQRQLWDQTRASVARRVEAGDAARLDLDVALAAVAQADARVAEAAGRVARVNAEFRAAYPELATVEMPGLCTPQADDQGLEAYRTRMFAEHHELAMAQAELDRRTQLAERARADEQPDPVFGVRVASDRGGAERLAGVVLTLPLGGANRTAATRSALASVEAARENLARVRRRLEGEVASLYASREGLFQSWRASQEALDRVSGVAALTGRAYALGETGLADLLSIRRQEQDARLQESMARTDACEVFYRLSLDTHALWPMDPSDHP